MKNNNFIFNLVIIIIVFLNIVFFIFAERIDILKVRANNMKKELNLNDEQTEKIYNIFKEEDKLNKSKIYNYNEQPLEEIIEKEKDNYDFIQKMLKEIFTNEQYMNYFSIKCRIINNELTLYLVKELNLNHQQAIEMNMIDQLIYMKIKYVKSEDKINQVPDSEETQKRMENIKNILFVLDKEISSKLNPEQLQIYKAKKDNINKYIKINIIGIEDLNKENNENPENKGNNKINRKEGMRRF